MPAVAEIYNKVEEVEVAPLVAADGERWIDINLSTYTLTAYVGTEPMLSTSIVIGSSMSPTVVGEFYTNWKLESQTMEGIGWDGTPYRQEDVPWVMYFFEDYAIHGAYWRDSFGYAGSQGCVNVPVGVAAELWNWAPTGTRVVAHY
jgi:lipoprotein-anchoring transpeptidase ErfK/SrfK